MKNIVTIKFGTKYQASTVNDLYNDIKKHYRNDFTFYCYTDNGLGLDKDIKIISTSDLEPIHDLNKPNYSHWNRFLFFDDYFLDNNEVILLDIDQRIIQDPSPVFDIESKDGEFYGIHRWWSMVDFTFDEFNKHYLIKHGGLDKFDWNFGKLYFKTITGAFYKFKPSFETAIIYDKFIQDKNHYMTYYQIKANLQMGHGEQNSVNELAYKYSKLNVISGKYYYTYYVDDTKRNNAEIIYKKLFNDFKNIIFLQTTSTNGKEIKALQNDRKYRKYFNR